MKQQSQEMSKREWNLKSESELRCVVTENESMQLQLIEGNAEIFGIEVSFHMMYDSFLYTYIFLDGFE